MTEAFTAGLGARLWSLSFPELVAELHAYNARSEEAWQRTAWQTALLMNVTGNLKTPVTATDLLHPPKPKRLTKRDLVKAADGMRAAENALRARGNPHD